MTGGSQTVSSGAILATVLSGGYQYVSGGTVDGTMDLDGGQLLVFSGVASNTIVSGGGQLLLHAGGSAVSATLIGSGSKWLPLRSSRAVWKRHCRQKWRLTTRSSAGVRQPVRRSQAAAKKSSLDGTAVSAVVNSGAQQFVFSGGTTTGSIVAKRRPRDRSIWWHRSRYGRFNGRPRRDFVRRHGIQYHRLARGGIFELFGGAQLAGTTAISPWRCRIPVFRLYRP